MLVDLEDIVLDRVTRKVKNINMGFGITSGVHMSYCSLIMSLVYPIKDRLYQFH